MIRSAAAALALLAAPALADPDEDAFVEANLLGIFYHELGHAMIHLLDMPVFGQEEDAADVASVLLIVALYEPETALDLAYDAAFGFAAEADLARGDVAWWDVHGPDEQRFYNTVCLFYGSDPDMFDTFAQDMALPEERAETCEEEFELAWDSWGAVLDDLSTGEGSPITFLEGRDSFSERVISAEVEALNGDFRWPRDLEVSIERCGEANAFYDLDAQAVIMCSELDAYLRDLYRM